MDESQENAIAGAQIQYDIAVYIYGADSWQAKYAEEHARRIIEGDTSPLPERTIL